MSQSHLFRTKRFLPLFITQFFGAFNDNFLKNALLILISHHGTAIMGIEPKQWVTIAAGIFILPFFLFSAQSGQLADKYDKAKLTRYVKISEIIIMLIAGLGFITHNYILLLCSVFLMGCHSTVFGPIKYGILPQHLKEEEMIGGNALIEAGTFLAILLGTILGGVLILLSGGNWIVSVGLLLLAVIGWAGSRLIPTAPPPDPDLRFNWNPIPPTIQILKYTGETPSVFRSIMGISWFWLVGANVLSMLLPYSTELLNGNEHVTTLFLTTFSVGIGLGSILCEKLSRRHLELGLVPMGSIGITVFTTDLFLVGIPEVFATAAPHSVTISAFLSSWPGIHILLDLFLLAVFSGFFIVPLYAFIQLRSNPKHRSRIIAGNNIMNALFMVIGSLMLSGMYVLKLSIPQIFLTLAILNAVVALYIYLLIPEFLLRFIVWCLANIIYRMKVFGTNNIPKEGPAVIVANHVSFVDWLILAAAIHRPVRFVMHHSFNRGPLKLLVKRAKVIPIASAKEDPVLMEEALRRAAEELKNGELVCIFPEGKITSDGTLSSFRPGILKIIEASPAPVIPIGIYNMWGSIFSRADGGAVWKVPKRFWTRIQVRIGNPIPKDQVSLAGLESQVKDLLSETPPAQK